MKKGIIILLAAFAVAAWAVDINPWQARSDSTYGQPSVALSGDQVKSLWDNADILNATQLGKISTDEGTKYNPGGTTRYNWIMVRLKHSAKAHNFTGHWEAYTDSYASYAMSVYVWNNATESWDHKDTGPKAIFTSPRNFTIATSYWTWNAAASAYTCLVLVEGRTVVGERNMHVDVVDAWY